MSMLSAQKLLAILFLLALSFPVCGQENIRITHTAFFRFDKTDIDIAYADKLSDANITKWFQLSEAKAREQQAEYSKLVILDNSQSFTLED